MFISGPERRQCPPDIQERVTRMFGTNEFGDPHFKIVWGQSQFIRLANWWKDKDGSNRKGYRETYQVGNLPCWVIMRWHAPAEYGSPDLYYAQTYDPSTDLYMVGEYPWRGRYEVVQPLISKEFIRGELKIEHFPISHFMVDVIIPMIVAYQHLSIEQKLTAYKLNREAEERALTEQIADMLEANAPTWWGPVSYSKQGIRTSLLDRKMLQIQKVWDQWSRSGRKPQFARGMAQGDRPTPIN